MKEFPIYIINQRELGKLKEVNAFYGICDMCNRTIMEDVYYIPVLHYGVCEECFRDWIERANYYNEDEVFIHSREKWMETIAEKLSIKIEERG